MATFSVNIFGAQNVNLDGSSSSGFKREFNLHILQVTSDVSVTSFDMFIEYYAYPWDVPAASVGRVTSLNGSGIVDRFTNNTPQIIHLDTMSPTVAPSLNTDCSTTPPSGTCPNAEDIRLFSMAHQVPIDGSASGYDSDETDMEDVGTNAILPVSITIIADGCRYSSPVDATINVYNDYNDAGELYGGTGDVKVIGEDEIIIVS